MTTPMETCPMNPDPDFKLEVNDVTFPSRQKVHGTRRLLHTIKSNLSILATFLGIILGFCLGMGIRQLHPSSDVITWIGLPGELFLRCLKMTIVPLLASLIINTTSSFNPRSNGKIAGVAFFGFLFTQFMATIIAFLLFIVFKPDVRDVIEEDKLKSLPTRTSDVFADLIRNIFPDNVVRAAIMQTVTEYSLASSDSNSTNQNSSGSSQEIEKKVANTDGLVTICATIGVAAHLVTADNGPFRTFFRELQEVVMLIVRWLFWTTPVGVASLIAASMAQVKDVSFVFETLALLIGSVTFGLFIHMFITIPAILFLLTRQNPYKFLLWCAKPYMLAFSSTVTSVALPDMLASGERCGVHPQVNNFVIPMSVSLHADGSSLFMASSALFIGQISNSLTGVGSYAIIGVLSTILGLAIPPVPSASIVSILIILSAANIPAQDIAMLFSVDWLLDRLRTGVNAVSHVSVAIATNALCKPGTEMDRQSEANGVRESLPEHPEHPEHP